MTDSSYSPPRPIRRSMRNRRLDADILQGLSQEGGNDADKWSFLKYKDCSIVLFSYKQEKTFVIYTLLKLRLEGRIFW